MIFLQPTAKSAIERAEMPSGYFGIRIKVQRAGCNGHAYAMEWCNKKEEHDFLIQDAEKDIYIDKKEAKAIVHAHSPHATAVSSHGKPIPPFHYMIALAGGDDIKCAEYATFGTEELSKNVIKALENRSACLMSNHGQVAFGKNLEDAFELAQEIENICHQYTIALKLGQPRILSFEEMKKVLDKAKNYKKG